MSPLGQVEQMMAFHQFWDAYQSLSSMIQDSGRKKGDSKLYRMRAECALNMLMIDECIRDVKLGIESHPNNHEKRLLKMISAKAHIQAGEPDLAELDARSINNHELIQQCQDLSRMINEANSKYDTNRSESSASLDNIIRVSPRAYSIIEKRAEIAWEKGETAKFDELSKILIDKNPDSGEMLYRRGLINFCAGKEEESQKMLSKAKKMKGAPSNISSIFKASNEYNRNLKDAKKYLEKKKQNEAQQFLNNAISSVSKICSENSQVFAQVRFLEARILIQGGKKDEGLELLNKAVAADPDNQDFLLERAEILLEQGDYDAALFDFTSIQRQNPNNRRAIDGINKANEMKKKATHVDYYAILGLQKGASDAEITKAFKLKVREWHPDRFQGKEKKDQAEKMMKAINIAYEVLNDPQKKQLYDAGQDPDNPMQQGGNPFGDIDPFEIIRQTMGGNPFEFMFGQGFGGGGGQQFEFQGGNGFQFHFQF